MSDRPTISVLIVLAVALGSACDKRAGLTPANDTPSAGSAPASAANRSVGSDAVAAARMEPFVVEPISPKGDTSGSETGWAKHNLRGRPKAVTYTLFRKEGDEFVEKDGKTKVLKFDEAGTLVEETPAPAPKKSDVKYDSHGNTPGITRPPPGAKEKIEYNERGLPIRVTAPDGTVTESSYDANGRVVARSVQGTYPTRLTWAYDEKGRERVKTIESFSEGFPGRPPGWQFIQNLECSYDEKPEQVTRTCVDKEKGTKYAETRDRHDNKIAELTYDANGNLESKTTTSLTYDDHGNIIAYEMERSSGNALTKVTSTSKYDQQNNAIETVTTTSEGTSVVVTMTKATIGYWE